MPALGFGTYRLTGRACRRGVTDAIEIGYRHIDTAQVYGNESQVGEGLNDAGLAREDLFLTTKVWMDSLEPREVHRSFEESLSKLQTEYVDLLLIHWPSDAMDLEATLDAMMELREEGRARNIGVSNFTADLTRGALEHAPIFCNQVEYHPYLSQDDLLKVSRNRDLLLTAYCPIARGEVMRDERVQEIGRRYDKTPAQTALRWLIQQEQVCAIPKAASPEHRRENFDVFDFELTDDEMDCISSFSSERRLVEPSWAPDW